MLGKEAARLVWRAAGVVPGWLEPSLLLLFSGDTPEETSIVERFIAWVMWPLPTHAAERDDACSWLRGTVHRLARAAASADRLHVADLARDALSVPRGDALSVPRGDALSVPRGASEGVLVQLLLAATTVAIAPLRWLEEAARVAREYGRGGGRAAAHGMSASHGAELARGAHCMLWFGLLLRAAPGSRAGSALTEAVVKHALLLAEEICGSDGPRHGSDAIRALRATLNEACRLPALAESSVVRDALRRLSEIEGSLRGAELDEH